MESPILLSILYYLFIIIMMLIPMFFMSIFFCLYAIPIFQLFYKDHKSSAWSEFTQHLDLFNTNLLTDFRYWLTLIVGVSYFLLASYTAEFIRVPAYSTIETIDNAIKIIPVFFLPHLLYFFKDRYF
jgi:Ca2+/Na+ antiporter